MRKKSKKNLKKYFYIGGGALIIATLAFTAGIATVFSSSEQNNQQAEIITVSTLQKIIKVSELSTYTAVYNGITEVTDKENPEDIDYYVSYEAKAYAGIDFDDIDIQVDNEKKEIQVHIPNVDITKIDVDIASMEFIFYDENENTSTVTETAYKACQADAQRESQKQQAIYDLAKQNASNVLTALIQPIVEQVDAEYDLVVS